MSLNVGFVIGTGRCGTTIIAQMLNAHSNICVPHEIQILFEYSNNGKRLNEVFASGENLHLSSADYIALVAARCPHRFDLYFDYEFFFESLVYPIKDLKALVNALYEAIVASRQKTIFLEQTPWYGQRIDIINSLFPDAKYIHVVRDGRDVAISYAKTPWWHDSVEKNLERWAGEINHITEQAHNILKPAQMLMVRYEDLVDFPEKELRRCSLHLGVDFENSMLDPSNFIDYSQYSKISTKAISSSSLNVWKEEKSAAVFEGSRYAWKTSKNFSFQSITSQISQTLISLGYEG